MLTCHLPSTLLGSGTQQIQGDERVPERAASDAAPPTNGMHSGHTAICRQMARQRRNAQPGQPTSTLPSFHMQ